MRKLYVYCDVCGKLVSDKTAPGVASDDETPYPAFVAAPGVADVCAKCASVGKRLDVGKLVLEEWRRRAKKKGPRKAADSAEQAKSPSGRRGRPRAFAPVAPEGANEGDGGEPPSDGAGSSDAVESAPVPAPSPEDVERVLNEMAEEAARNLAAREDEASRRGGRRVLSVHAEDKRRVHAALSAYRDERGLGAFAELAERSGVSDVVIRGMLAAKPVGVESWAAVGRALGVPFGSDDDVFVDA